MYPGFVSRFRHVLGTRAALGIISSIPNISVISFSSFKYFTPAKDKTIASYWPSFNFFILVSTLPLISLQFISGLIFLIWNSLLYEDVPTTDFKSNSFINEISKLDKSKIYLIYCRSGNRSSKAATIMDSLGFKKTIDLEGGFLRW